MASLSKMIIEILSNVEIESPLFKSCPVWEFMNGGFELIESKFDTGRLYLISNTVREIPYHVTKSEPMRKGE
ncbi:MAG: hypothetical protein KGI25_06550 [Thaumarchaeota archaeon]|nr:hypothetical protein [Nitrososphaerota archaeon]